MLRTSLCCPKSFAFLEANLSAKSGKCVSLIIFLRTKFSYHVQDISAIGKEIQLFSTPLLVDAEVDDSLQLDLTEMQCDYSEESTSTSLPTWLLPRLPLMRRHSKIMFRLFGSPYICEQTFSLFNLNKGRFKTKITDAFQPPNSWPTNHDSVQTATSLFTL